MQEKNGWFNLAAGQPSGPFSHPLLSRLGSTTLVLDETGAEVGHLLYDPYGEELVNTTLPPDLIDRLFTGQRYDAELGLYDHGANFYDPFIGLSLQSTGWGGLPGVPAAGGGHALPALGAVGVGKSMAGGNNLVTTPLGSNLTKKGLGYPFPSAIIRGLTTYYKAALSRGRPIYYSLVTRNVPRSQIADDVIVKAATAGLVAKHFIGAPSGSLRERFFRSGRSLIEHLAVLNSKQIYEIGAKGYSVAYRLPAGRIAGHLAYTRYGKHAVDFGLGFAIDVAWQAAWDYPLLARGDLTLGQYGGRLGVAAVGSGIAWILGVGAGALAAAAFGAPAIVVGAATFAVGLGASVIYDQWFAPRINESLGFEPGTIPFWERKIKNDR